MTFLIAQYIYFLILLLEENGEVTVILRVISLHAPAHLIPATRGVVQFGNRFTNGTAIFSLQGQEKKQQISVV